jgi:ribosomal protein S18 acetylase RimI-like enzyme
VQFRIRQFEKTDFQTLWQIDQACFDPQLAYSQRELAFYMRRPGSFTLVADRMVSGIAVARAGAGKVPSNGKARVAIPNPGILGFIVAEARGKVGHIITIDVIAEARRAGVGTALLQAAEEQLLQSGAAAIALETPVDNSAAIRFYKQKGYFVEKTVAGYYSNQMDALIMTKELALSP